MLLQEAPSYQTMPDLRNGFLRYGRVDCLKVLLVSSATPEYRIEGGIVTHLALLRRDLSSRGHAVHTLTAIPPGVSETPSTGSVSYVHPALHDGVPLGYHLNLLGAYTRLRSAFSPDVVHIHSHSGAAIAMKERRIPVVTTVHAADPPETDAPESRLTSLYRTVERAVKRRQTTALLRCSDKVFVPSAKTARDLRGFCPQLDLGDLEILPVGVDLHRFRPVAKGDVKARLGYEGRFVFLFVGRMTRKKGADDLVRTAPAVLSEIEDAVLVIIGTGPMREALMKEAARLGVSDRVHFIGAVPNRELPAYYNAADVFVNPTRENETFGLTTVEAMACGLPVIISRSGAETGIASPREARIFDGRDELIANMKELRADDGLRDVLAARGPQQAKQFSFDRVAARLDDCYRDLITAGKTPSAAAADRDWGSFWCANVADGRIRWLRRMRNRVSGYGESQTR